MTPHPQTDTLENAVVIGVVHKGITVQTRDGRPAQLAIIDDDGNVIESGPAVAREVWHVSVQVHRNFWIGKGHLRVISGAHTAEAAT